MKYKVTLRLGWPALLTAVFAVLKWCKVIGWPWLWVLSPLWIMAILWGFVILAVAIFGFKYNRKN